MFNWENKGFIEKLGEQLWFIVNIFNNIKKRTNGKSTGGGCCLGEEGGVSHLGRSSRCSSTMCEQTALADGRFPSNTATLNQKCHFLPVHSIAIFQSHSASQQNQLGQKGVWRTVNCQNKIIIKSCSWIRSSPGRQKKGTCPKSLLTFCKIIYFVSSQETRWGKSLVDDFSTDKVPVLKNSNQGKRLKLKTKP